MLVVAGLSLKNLHPRVWDPGSPYHLPDLRAVMVSYAEFHRMPAQRRAAMDLGLREYLGVSEDTKAYLDNGDFYCLSRGGDTPVEEYDQFVKRAGPDCGIGANARLSEKRHIALGGIVPNLLRKPKAVPYQAVLDALVHVRRTFANNEVQ